MKGKKTDIDLSESRLRRMYEGQEIGVRAMATLLGISPKRLKKKFDEYKIQMRRLRPFQIKRD